MPAEPDLCTAHEHEVLRLLLERAPMGIAVLDRDLALRRWNPTWAEFIARATAAPADRVAPGARLLDLAPDAAATTLRRCRRALAGETVREEGIRLESEGRVSYWDAVTAPLGGGGEGDGAAGVVDVVVDATERMLAREALEGRVEERTRNLAAALAATETVAAESTRLYAETKRRADESERRWQIAESLRDILDVLNSSRPLDEVLDYIVGQACRIGGTDAGAIYRLDPRERSFVIQCSRGLPPDHATGAVIPAQRGLVGEVLDGRQLVAIADIPEFLGRAAGDLDPPVQSLLARLAEHFRALLAVPLVAKGEVYGALILHYPHARPFDDDDKRLAVAFAHHAALAIENARLRARAESSAIAAERSRLARDLHDAVTQTLFSASLIAEVLPRLWERSPDEGRRRLEEVRQLTRGAMAEMRTLLLELRPAALAEAALGDLLRQLAEATTGRARVPVALSVEGQRPVPVEVKTALYRIAQEALNNVARHSGASHATVGLRCLPAAVELSVGDDGRGFDPSATPPGHLGLCIMRERAEAIGATFAVETGAGRGTRIAVAWPDPAQG